MTVTSVTQQIPANPNSLPPLQPGVVVAVRPENTEQGAYWIAKITKATSRSLTVQWYQQNPADGSYALLSGSEGYSKIVSKTVLFRGITFTPQATILNDQHLAILQLLRQEQT